MHDTALGWRLVNPRMAERHSTEAMGETAENVAERYGISREDQDAFALRSHQRAVAASDEGRFDDAARRGRGAGRRRGDDGSVDVDEGPRADTTLERLAALAPGVPRGRHRHRRQRLDPQRRRRLPRARLGAQGRGARRASRWPASSPSASPASTRRCMGIGPVPAIRRALDAAGLELDEIDLIEINEAFAAQVLACARELGIDEERLNVNGGAIALGHPLGCSGARLLTTLAWELRRRGGRYGIASLCVGVGQGAGDRDRGDVTRRRERRIASRRWHHRGARIGRRRDQPRPPRRRSRCATTASTAATASSR